jgi:hypothetical protein
MKAVLLYSYGDPSQLRYEETAVPKYGDNEVLVRIRATSINPIDVKIRSGAAESRDDSLLNLRESRLVNKGSAAAAAWMNPLVRNFRTC